MLQFDMVCTPCFSFLCKVRYKSMHNFARLDVFYLNSITWTSYNLMQVKTLGFAFVLWIFSDLSISRFLHGFYMWFFNFIMEAPYPSNFLMLFFGDFWWKPHINISSQCWDIGIRKKAKARDRCNSDEWWKYKRNIVLSRIFHSSQHLKLFFWWI